MDSQQNFTRCSKKICTQLYLNYSRGRSRGSAPNSPLWSLHVTSSVLSQRFLPLLLASCLESWSCSHLLDISTNSFSLIPSAKWMLMTPELVSPSLPPSLAQVYPFHLPYLPGCLPFSSSAVLAYLLHKAVLGAHSMAHRLPGILFSLWCTGALCMCPQPKCTSCTGCCNYA